MPDLVGGQHPARRHGHTLKGSFGLSLAGGSYQGHVNQLARHHPREVVVAMGQLDRAAHARGQPRLAIGQTRARRVHGGGAPTGATGAKTACWCPDRAGQTARRLGALEQIHHVAANAGKIAPETDQHLGGHALTFAHQAQQDVLGADVVVTELQSLPQ